MNSAFFRSFLLAAALILFSFLSLGLLFMSMAPDYLSEQRRTQLNGHADVILSMNLHSVNEYSVPKNGSFSLEAHLSTLPEFFFFVNSVSELTDTTILLADSAGRVVISTNRLAGDTIPEDTLQSMQNDSTLGVRALGDLFPGDRVSVGRVIKSRSGLVGGYLVITATAASQNELLGGFMRLFWIAGVAVLLFSCISAYLVSRRMARPLQIMAQASRAFARGEFGIRAPQGKSSDEVDELAEAFNAMADALQKAEELRSGFVANVSHELKTPMTTIAGFIDGVLDGTIPKEKHKEYLTAIRSEVMRLSRLVSSMLNIARLQAGQAPAHRQFDVVDLLCRTLLSFEAAIEKKSIQVETALPAEPVFVRSDPDAITQVVYNLLDNAIKYGSQGGKLWLTLRKKGGKLLISVRNEGPCIPPEDLPYIFERFHKADKSRGMDKASLGLGLYIVKTILGNMRESITAASSNGITTLTFTIATSENKR